MDWVLGLNNDISNWLWANRSYIATSWVAVLLVLYGDNIIRFLKGIMRPYHYILKVTAFILLCSIGFGLLANFGYKALYQLLPLIERQWFGLVVVVIYFILGTLAENKNRT